MSLTVQEVHIGTPADKCREISNAGYNEEDFENLIFRYEEPNGMTRWDSPLFTVLDEDETPPFENIWEALVGNDGKVKLVRPNNATVLVRIAQCALTITRSLADSACA